MVDFEGPDFWMRLLGQIMVHSESSYLITGHNSNDQNEFGYATRRLPPTRGSKMCSAVKPQVTFVNCTAYRFQQKTSFPVLAKRRLYENANKTPMVFELPEPSGPSAFWPSDALCFSVVAPENPQFLTDSAAMAPKHNYHRPE